MSSKPVLILGGGPVGFTAMMTLIRSYRQNPQRYQNGLEIDLVYDRPTFERSQTVRIDKETAEIIRQTIGPVEFGRLIEQDKMVERSFYHEKYKEAEKVEYVFKICSYEKAFDKVINKLITTMTQDKNLNINCIKIKDKKQDGFQNIDSQGNVSLHVEGEPVGASKKYAYILNATGGATGQNVKHLEKLGFNDDIRSMTYSVDYDTMVRRDVTGKGFNSHLNPFQAAITFDVEESILKQFAIHDLTAHIENQMNRKNEKGEIQPSSFHYPMLSQHGWDKKAFPALVSIAKPKKEKGKVSLYNLIEIPQQLHEDIRVKKGNEKKGAYEKLIAYARAVLSQVLPDEVVDSLSITIQPSPRLDSSQSPSEKDKSKTKRNWLKHTTFGVDELQYIINPVKVIKKGTHQTVIVALGDSSMMADPRTGYGLVHGLKQSHAVAKIITGDLISAVNSNLVNFMRVDEIENQIKKEDRALHEKIEHMLAARNQSEDEKTSNALDFNESGKSKALYLSIKFILDYLTKKYPQEKIMSFEVVKHFKLEDVIALYADLNTNKSISKEDKLFVDLLMRKPELIAFAKITDLPSLHELEAVLQTKDESNSSSTPLDCESIRNFFYLLTNAKRTITVEDVEFNTQNQFFSTNLNLLDGKSLSEASNHLETMFADNFSSGTWVLVIRYLTTRLEDIDKYSGSWIKENIHVNVKNGLSVSKVEVYEDLKNLVKHLNKNLEKLQYLKNKVSEFADKLLEEGFADNLFRAIRSLVTSLQDETSASWIADNIRETAPNGLPVSKKKISEDLKKLVKVFNEKLEKTKSLKLQLIELADNPGLIKRYSFIYDTSSSNSQSIYSAHRFMPVNKYVYAVRKRMEILNNLKRSLENSHLTNTRAKFIHHDDRGAKELSQILRQLDTIQLGNDYYPSDAKIHEVMNLTDKVQTYLASYLAKRGNAKIRSLDDKTKHFYKTFLLALQDLKPLTLRAADNACYQHHLNSNGK